MFTRRESGSEDTVNDQETEVPEQQDGEDEGRMANKVSRGFLLPDTPAAPGGRPQPIRTEQQRQHYDHLADSLSDGVEEKDVAEDDRQPLEKHGGGAGVVQVLHHQHVSVEVPGRLRQAELEPGEERRVVQGPLRRVLRQSSVHFSSTTE